MENSSYAPALHSQYLARKRRVSKKHWGMCVDGMCHAWDNQLFSPLWLCSG